MQSDVKALLKVFGASFLVVVIGMGVLVAAAANVIARDTAVYIAFGIFVVGAIVIGRLYGPSLTKRHHPKPHNHKHK